MSEHLTIRQSLVSLEVSRVFSERNQNESNFVEPDDSIDNYIDFLENINSADWGNDNHLQRLIDAVFCRKKEAED